MIQLLMHPRLEKKRTERRGRIEQMKRMVEAHHKLGSVRRSHIIEARDLR